MGIKSRTIYREIYGNPNTEFDEKVEESLNSFIDDNGIELDKVISITTTPLYHYREKDCERANPNPYMYGVMINVIYKE